MSVCEALFEMRLLSRIAGARKDGVMVREGVGANNLSDLGKGLDGAVVAQAATEEEKAETGVEASQKLRDGTIEVNVAVIAVGIVVFGFGQYPLGGIGEVPVKFEEM